MISQATLYTLVEQATLDKLSNMAAILTGKCGYKVTRADLIRAILNDYIERNKL